MKEKAKEKARNSKEKATLIEETLYEININHKKYSYESTINHKKYSMKSLQTIRNTVLDGFWSGSVPHSIITTHQKNI